MTESDTPGTPVFLRNTDFAGKLTPGGSVPTRLSRPDEVAIWHLGNRTLLVDTDTGFVFRRDGVTRAERAKPDGYGFIYLGRIDGKIRFARAHRVVWIAAHGPIPGMYEVNHRNGRRWDNRLANLDMVTHGANMRHAYRLPYEHVAGEPFLGEEDRPSINPYATADNRIASVHARRSRVG